MYVGVGGRGWKGVGVGVASEGAWSITCLSLPPVPGATKTADSAAIPDEQAETNYPRITNIRMLANALFVNLVFANLVFVNLVFVNLMFVSVLSILRLFKRIILSVV